MYSRYSFQRKEGVTLPENYSGCAFSRGTPVPVPPHDPPPLKRPSEPPPVLPVPAPPKEELPPPHTTEAAPPPKQPLALLPSLTGALDFDQLLILGLILLLLHSGEDREIVLWLILLLFC